MYFYLIPISIFILGMVIFAYLQRNNFLEKMQWLPGEQILFEDAKCAFQSVVSMGRSSYYPMGHACVTNERIILAQRGLFGKARTIRFVIPYGDQRDPEEDLGYVANALKTGHIVFRTAKEKIQWKEGKKIGLYIPAQQEDSGFQVRGVLFFPLEQEKWKKFLGS